MRRAAAHRRAGPSALILLLAAIAAAAAERAAAPLAFRELGTADGLPQLTVFALAEDAEGFLLAGTQDGLARWDGRRFSALALPGEGRGWVTRLLRDAAGRVWIGDDHRGLLVLEAGRVRAVRAAGEPVRDVRALARDGAGEAVWVGTGRGLLHCRQDCVAVPAVGELAVTAVLAEPGRLWVGGDFAGLYRHPRDDAGRVLAADRHWQRADGLPNDAIRALQRLPAAQGGQLWVGTGRGLAALQDDDTLQPLVELDGRRLGTVLALALLPGADGPALIAGLHGAGLAWRDAQGRWRLVDERHGLSAGFFHDLLVAGDAASPLLWLASAGRGVLRLEPGRWRTFDERHGLPHRGVVALGMLPEAEGGGLWAGTLGGAAVFRDNRWQPLLPPLYAQLVVHDLVAAADGRRWLATTQGLLEIDGERRRLLTVDELPLPGVGLQRLLWQADGAGGSLWIGGRHGLGRMRAGRYALLLQDDPLWANTAVHALLPLPDGDLLVAGAAGVLRLRDAAAQPLPAACAAAGDTSSLLRGGDGALWIGGRHGLLRARIGADGRLDCGARLPDPRLHSVYRLVEDARGRIYVFSYAGALRLQAPRADDPLAGGVLHYGPDDGLPTPEFNRGGLRDAHGLVWGATTEGVVRLDPEAAADAPATPRLHLQASLAGRPLAEGEHLAADHPPLQFAPRLLSFRAEHRIRYRSQLLGLDPAPGAWRADADRRVDRLPAGRYRFRVEARDAAGVVHGPVEIGFRVAPPWWRHPLALLLAALGLLSLGLGIGRWRSRALHRRAAELARLVDERTAALHRASCTDPLTGCWNRRWFYQQLPGWVAAQREHGGLLLLLVDIDHFKQINDRHGHRCGDEVLVAVAARLRETLASRELPVQAVVRWGGEEFLLAAGAAALDDDALARALLRAVGDSAIAGSDGELEVTCSIGYTRCRPPAEGIDAHIDLVIARADEGLYAAKRGGRDRAVGVGYRAADGSEPQRVHIRRSG